MGNSELEKRAQKAAAIIAEPSGFKVCEGCDSIVRERVACCPNCNGYRFDDSAEAVRAQARILAARPPQSVRPEDLQ